jgi:hypothetical protein
LHTQNNLPAWYDPYSSVMISEYQNWKEVNDWAMELFAIPNNISPSLQKKISEIKLKSSLPEQQTLEALRFVQDDIRYMGIEMGTNSHKPNHPNKVFAQRFGDCKDKSYLLCTILNGLGIECAPVLINTEWKKAIIDWLPSPKSFNHVTVRAKLKDGYHWFDPTISFQRGSIKDISYPDYQCGLVINENTSDLTAIKLKEPGMVRVKEVFDIKNTSDSVRFSVTTNYSGSFADNVRNSFNSMSNYQLLKDYRSYYLDYYKDILADSLNYKDDANTGVFTTKEYYTIPNIWELKNGTKKASFSSYVIDGIIKKPKETARTMPFSLQYPAHYHEEIEINIPDDWNAEQSLNNLKNDGFKMLANFYYSNKKFLLEYEYENLKDHISTNEVKQYLIDLNKKEETLSYELSQKDKPLVKTSKTNDSGNGYLYAKILVLLVIVGIIIEWRRRR